MNTSFTVLNPCGPTRTALCYPAAILADVIQRYFRAFEALFNTGFALNAPGLCLRSKCG